MKGKLYCLLALLLVNVTAFAQSSLYVVSFTDKPNYHAENPIDFLSQRTMEKKNRLQIAVGYEDAPVYAMYIDSVLTEPVTYKTHSKWFNYVVVSMEDTIAQTISRWSFVRDVCLLRDYDMSSVLTEDDTVPDVPTLMVPDHYEYPTLTLDTLSYGSFYRQIGIHQGQYMHQENYRGQNMLIAILDGGYEHLDSMAFWQSWRDNQCVFTRNLTDEPNLYSGTSHGTTVLSIMASNDMYQCIGTAPEADYAIIKTEVCDYEEYIEEFFLVRGLEIADSMGADVVNISLGYTEFDTEADNHDTAYLDGLHYVSSVAVSKATRKGSIVCVAVGNSGDNDWHYIGSPCDGRDGITVAAVDSAGNVADFSSRGGLQSAGDKPNVAAIGYHTYYYGSNDSIVQGNGTSLATPIITGLTTCLWQAYPEKTPLQIRQAIMMSCSNYPYYDSLSGYGIPDFWKAFSILKVNDLSCQNVENIGLHVYPNPCQDQLTIETQEDVSMSLYDISGKLHLQKSLKQGVNSVYIKDLPKGEYIIQFNSQKGIVFNKMLKN